MNSALTIDELMKSYRENVNYTCYTYFEYYLTPLMYLIVNIKYLIDGMNNLEKYLSSHPNEINESNTKYGMIFKDDVIFPLTLVATHSSEKYNISILKLLIKYNADVNLRDKYGQTALLKSIRYVETTSNYTTIKYLLECGANINLAMNNELTALHNVFEYVYKKTKIVKLLLSYHPDIYTANRRNVLETALMWGSKLKDLKLIINYMKTNDVNGSYDNYIYKALRAYIKEYDVDYKITKFLLKNGGNKNINKQNKNGKTLIGLYALRVKISDKIFMLLLKNGANPNIKSNENYSALYYLIYNIKVSNSNFDYEKLIKLIINTYIDCNDIYSYIDLFFSKIRRIKIPLSKYILPFHHIIILLINHSVTNINLHDRLQASVFSQLNLVYNKKYLSLYRKLFDEISEIKKMKFQILKEIADQANNFILHPNSLSIILLGLQKRQWQ